MISSTWLLRWNAGQRKTIYLCALVLGSSALVLLFYLRFLWDEYTARTVGHRPYSGDFFALWSYAKIAFVHPVAELYDVATLHARQVALGMEPGGVNPFPYPPTFMLLLWPLGLLSYDMAHVVWIAGTLALFVWAVWGTCSRLPLCLLGAVVAPASIANIHFGQSGFLAAALIVAGVRLAGSQPILGGVLIGILSYKPQLGFLVPIALVSAGYWRALAAASATTIAMAVLATALFGWAVWPAWMSMLPAYAEMFDRNMVMVQFMPTLMVNLQTAGVALPIAKAAQVLAAIAVAVLVSRCFRRDPGRLATAALLVGTFVATPHAFVYDLPMIVAAVALFIEQRLETSATFTAAEVLVLVLAVMFPALMLMEGVALPASIVPLALLFGLIVRQQNRSAGAAGQNWKYRNSVVPPKASTPSAAMAPQASAQREFGRQTSAG